MFAGTPAFAVASLEAALAHPKLSVCACYTQPDRPSGRGRKPRAGEVKQCALNAGLPVYQPVRLDPAAIDEFRALEAELLIVAAYGLILPAALIEIPRHAINVHASLLPRWRGAAPIQRAIMAGDTHSGISIMRIVEALDAGPVWLEQRCDIAPRETGGTLHDKLAVLGGRALAAAIDALFAGSVIETAQDPQRATYAGKITSVDREVDWHRDAQEIERQIRALAPAPGARCRLGDLELRLLAAHVGAPGTGTTPGTFEVRDGELLVATASDDLVIDVLQPAGKQRMPAAAFINGYGQYL